MPRGRAILFALQRSREEAVCEMCAQNVLQQVRSFISRHKSRSLHPVHRNQTRQVSSLLYITLDKVRPDRASVLHVAGYNYP